MLPTNFSPLWGSFGLSLRCPLFALLASLSLAVVSQGQALTETDEYLPSDGYAQQRFATALALDGDLLAVGAPRDDEVALDKGALYVFERQGDAWIEQEKLLPEGVIFARGLGTSVDVQGDTIVGGSTQICSSCTGTVYVFERDGVGGWDRQRIPASGTMSGAYGVSVALDGDTIAVGSENYHAGFGVRPGAVLIWRRSGTSWALEATLLASDGLDEDRFGAEVDLVGDRLVVSAPSHDGAGTSSGAVYVFERSGTAWSEVQQLSGTQAFDAFGIALSAQEDRLAVGASGVGSGVLALFEHDGSAYVPSGTVPAPAGTSSFAGEVVLRGDRLIASSVGNQQTVATFQWPLGQPAVMQDVLVPGDSFQPGGGFGDSLAIGSDAIIVGDFGDGGNGSLAGSFYTYDPDQPAPGSTFCECVLPSQAPCGNVDPEAGCTNSTGSGAWLRTSRSASVALDNLVISAYQAVGSFSVFVMGDTAIQQLFFDGQRCVGGNVFRFPISTGFPSIGPGIVNDAPALFGPQGAISAGDTRIFQVWFRDASGPCGMGANLSNAVSVTFTP